MDGMVVVGGISQSVVWGESVDRSWQASRRAGQQAASCACMSQLGEELRSFALAIDLDRSGVDRTLRGSKKRWIDSIDAFSSVWTEVFLGVGTECTLHAAAAAIVIRSIQQQQTFLIVRGGRRAGASSKWRVFVNCSYNPSRVPFARRPFRRPFPQRGAFGASSWDPMVLIQGIQGGEAVDEAWVEQGLGTGELEGEVDAWIEMRGLLDAHTPDASLRTPTVHHTGSTHPAVVALDHAP